MQNYLELLISQTSLPEVKAKVQGWGQSSVVEALLGSHVQSPGFHPQLCKTLRQLRREAHQVLPEACGKTTVLTCLFIHQELSDRSLRYKEYS